MMNLRLFSVTTLFPFIFFWNPISASVNGYRNPESYFVGDVAINCGYLGNSTALDGRQWFGDTGSRSVMSVLQPKGKSRISTADHRSIYADPIPYMTARLSATQFYYIFKVNAGQKFIRLHFHPSSYCGFEKSEDFFTVRAGAFTLLRNFSASLSAHALGVKYLVREFVLNVEENKYLNLSFSPSQSTKQRNIYAFVNGIEIISMPTGLYYTPDGDLGAHIVGQNNRYFVDNGTALEMVQRLNIGGSSISPAEDFGMFRRWSEDVNHLLESKLEPVYHLVHGIKYTRIPVFAAPLKIYQTSWKTGKNGRPDKVHDFTWKMPVDIGYGYLVRLHFCDFGLGMTEGGRREFNVLINNQTAETKVDVIRLSGESGVPIYRDYMVMVRGDKEAGKRDLLIALQSSDELVVGLLHGIEIFKLSNSDNSLASPNPVLLQQVSTSWNLKIQNLHLAFGGKNAIATCMTIIIISLNIIVFKLREIWEETSHGEKDTRSTSSEQSFHRFSFAEIKSATRNFSDALLIGKGGFGNVYKGYICGGSEMVAVKRLKWNSKQGAREFWAEIETFSKIRHIHLVSLRGYCNEFEEMILVYEYMPHGTLADNLYRIGRNGEDGTPLTWEQRLRICIGAARGLDYLHTGIKFGVIHRDVKDSNILLDENLAAKISDFGLSRLGNLSESQINVSTNVKGTFGYLDPNYIMTHKPTRKSDVYAFGVVMLVVLCGRPAVDRRIPGEAQSLLSSFRECVSKGEINEIIDLNLKGKISSESLSEFVTSIEGCLHHQPRKRPTMAQMVASLEYALERQQIIPSSISDEGVSVGQPCEVENMQPSQFNQLMVPAILAESVTVISALEEGINTKAIQNANIKTKGENFQSREKNHSSLQKALWGWPWEAPRNGAKKMKKKELVSYKGYQFSIADIRAATDNFNDDHVIVNNEFMMLYKGFIKTIKAAIYRFETEVYDEEVPEFCNEIEKLSQIRHQNLAFLIGYCYHENKMFIVYQYIGNDTLHNYLYDDSCIPLPWNQRLWICLGVAQGLDYLHSCTAEMIIHGDLRPTNILLADDWTPNIANTGLSKVSPTGHLANASTSVNPSWMEYLPPELIAYQPGVTKKNDVYSFGLVLLEVLCGRRPVSYDDLRVDYDERHLKTCVTKGIKTRTLHEIIDSKLKGQIAETCLGEYLKIAFSCLTDKATERPSMNEVVERVKIALHLQENAEVAKVDMNQGHGDKAFNFEHIYQEISNLAAHEEFNVIGSVSTEISGISQQTFEQNATNLYSYFSDIALGDSTECLLVEPN